MAANIYSERVLARGRKNKEGEIKSFKFVSDEFQATLGNKQAIDFLYASCLRKKGLLG